MPKQYIETLVVAGPHIRDLLEEIATLLDKIPPGELEVSQYSNHKLIIRSYNPFVAVLAHTFDVLRKRFPRHEFVLTSGRDGDTGRIAGYREGVSIFESKFEFIPHKLPRAAEAHRTWLTRMFSS